MSAWVMVPSCMSLSRFGEISVNCASASLARSCVKALLGAVHALFTVVVLQVMGAIGRSLAEQLDSAV